MKYRTRIDNCVVLYAFTNTTIIRTSCTFFCTNAIKRQNFCLFFVFSFEHPIKWSCLHNCTTPPMSITWRTYLIPVIQYCLMVASSRELQIWIKGIIVFLNFLVKGQRTRKFITCIGVYYFEMSPYLRKKTQGNGLSLWSGKSSSPAFLLLLEELYQNYHNLP